MKLFKILFCVLFGLYLISAEEIQLSDKGCTCLTLCEFRDTFPAYFWCRTSDYGVKEEAEECGPKYNSDGYFWDTCVPVSSELVGSYLTTKSDIFKTVFFYTTVTCAITFLCFGLTTVKFGKRLIIVPALSILVGGITGAFSGAISGFVIALIYDAIPYDMDWEVGVAFGIGHGLLVTYMQMGRDIDMTKERLKVRMKRESE
eukprot:TRINITY_DN5203_c0_g2_i1.p1 TRINITY_DN5203_c0_g2~~TRINITY_DN5203_c0_g2_i1.p1  ORF type:complete len:209 (-),score=23.23 TRINITY_DN5203_c0_g2_i1:162-767(-)